MLVAGAAPEMAVQGTVVTVERQEAEGAAAPTAMVMAAMVAAVSMAMAVVAVVAMAAWKEPLVGSAASNLRLKRRRCLVMTTAR